MPSHLQPSFHTLTYVPLLVGISAAASSALGILGTNNKLDWKEILEYSEQHLCAFSV